MINRIGLHFFSDTDHYQVKDLTLWLSEFKQMKISWLVLESPVNYAIPEEFIKNVINQGITPIIYFNMRVNSSTKPDDLRVILASYARWGIKYIVLFNSPNLKRNWEEGTWSQADLVDRFIDRYVGFTDLVISLGMIPVFSPLQPGGDYWDTTFLKKYLLTLQQRRLVSLLSGIHIAVSAQSFDKPIDWGKGGSSSWAPKMPYSDVVSEDSQDHIGMQTWEWYTEIVHSITKTVPKIFLFWYGASNVLEKSQLDSKLSLEQLIDLANMDPSSGDPETKGLVFGENVIACNLWLLSSQGKETESKASQTENWQSQGMQAINRIKTYQAQQISHSSPEDLPVAKKIADWVYPINHYLLLPSFDWGVPEHILELVRPIIRESRLTIGFSLSEASLARKVTIWNENNAFSDDDINFLKRSGCEIDEKIINGINLATDS